MVSVLNPECRSKKTRQQNQEWMFCVCVCVWVDWSYAAAATNKFLKSQPPHQSFCSVFEWSIQYDIPEANGWVELVFVACCIGMIVWIIRIIQWEYGNNSLRQSQEKETTTRSKTSNPHESESRMSFSGEKKVEDWSGHWKMWSRPMYSPNHSVTGISETVPFLFLTVPVCW